jgi:hypothetical protein
MQKKKKKENGIHFAYNKVISTILRLYEDHVMAVESDEELYIAGLQLKKMECKCNSKICTLKLR